MARGDKKIAALEAIEEVLRRARAAGATGAETRRYLRAAYKAIPAARRPGVGYWRVLLRAALGGGVRRLKGFPHPQQHLQGTG